MFEWWAWCLMLIAIAGAVFLGVLIAMLADGNQASMEARDEHQCCDVDRIAKNDRAQPPRWPAE